MRPNLNEAQRCRHYGGILVVAPPTELEECRRHLARWVEVHQVEAETGRIIAVLETSRLEDQERLLRQVRQSPHVLLAELVYYRRDPEPAGEAGIFEEAHEIGRRGA